MFAIFEGVSSPNPEPRTDDFKGKENRNPKQYRISNPGFKTCQVFFTRNLKTMIQKI